jgi:RimJ/RimL family protein N-acetyltransferase
LGEKKVKLDKRVSKIVGYVLPQNIASCKIFSKLGYVLELKEGRHMYIKKTK